MDYALVWNDKTKAYDIYTMADHKTQLNCLGSIPPQDIEVEISEDWKVQSHGTG